MLVCARCTWVWYMYATISTTIEDPESKKPKPKLSKRKNVSGPALIPISYSDQQSCSIEFKFVEHIRRVLRTALACSVHVLRVIPLHATLLVAAEGIAGEVGVLVVEVLLCFIRLLGRGGLIGWVSFSLAERGLNTAAAAAHINGGAKERGQKLTLTNAETKSKGNPYLRTVSTNTRRTST